MNRRHGFILVYAVGTMVLVSALASTLLDTSAGDVAVAKARMYHTLARVNADSGIEFGMAVIARELARRNGPWRNPSYVTPPDCSLNWMRHVFAGTPPNVAPASCSVTTQEEVAETSGQPLHQLQFESEGTSGGTRWVSQFYLALAPEMQFDRVRLETEMGNPHVFVLRSRGEVNFPDPGGGPPEILATAYAFQTFTIEFPDECPTPKCTRQVWQMDIDPTGQLNWPVRNWPAGIPTQPPVGARGPVSGALMLRPNAH